MTKAIIWYLVMGMILMGAALGLYENKCGSQDMPSAELVIGIITWPTIIGYVMTRNVPPNIVCKS